MPSVGIGNTNYSAVPHAFVWNPIVFPEASYQRSGQSGVVNIQNNIFFVTSAVNLEGVTGAYDDSSTAIRIKLDFQNTLPETAWNNVIIRKNTFYHVPGTCVFVHDTYTTPNALVNFTIGRNIFDQSVDFSQTTEYLFSRRKYDENQPSTSSDVSDINWTNYNLWYSGSGAITEGTDSTFYYADANSLPLVQSYNDFALDTDLALDWDWISVAYVDPAKDLTTYSSASLGHSPNVGDFISNALATHSANGWSSAYGAEQILQHIWNGFKPSNLDTNDYAEDYVGAVEFASSAPPLAGFTIGFIGPKFHGHGLGF